MQEKKYKLCTRFIKNVYTITISFPRFAQSCAQFINRAHDLAYYFFPACHVRGSVENCCAVKIIFVEIIIIFLDSDE